MRREKYRLLLSVAVVGLLIPSLSFGQTGRLQGSVDQNQSLPSDEFASGGNCDWMTGACNLLHAYMNQGGSDARCLDPLNQGVAYEREEQQLLKAARQSFELNKRARELEQLRDRILQNIQDCFAGKHEIIPISAVPIWQKDACHLNQTACELLVHLVALGPDYLRYMQLKANYAKDQSIRAGYETQLRMVVTMSNPDSPDFNKQIRSLQTDLYLNRVDMDDLRKSARAILDKAAKNSPGMAVDNGVQILLDDEFPPAQ